MRRLRLVKPASGTHFRVFLKNNPVQRVIAFRDFVSMAPSVARYVVVKGNQNAVKHGLYTHEAIEERRQLRRLVTESRKILKDLA